MDGFEALTKALAQHGVALKQFQEHMDSRVKTLGDRLLEVEQKAAKRVAELDGGAGGAHGGELTDLIMRSEGLQAFSKGMAPSVQIAVPGKLVKAAILNSGSVLAAADRRPGIVAAPQRRFTIRSLLPAIPTESNSVEFTRELTFQNSAGPQYDASSPDPHAEGAQKNESGMTFELATAQVITLAHWIPASRQVLSDAPALQQHVEGRLLYGLALEEEDEMLNGTGSSGSLNGLINQATAFAGGGTNLTALDAVALGLAQLIEADYEPSGIVLNPADWWSSKFMLAKNSQGEYLLGEPGSMAEPRLWGIPVVVTGSMPAGKFLCIDGQRAAFVADREDAVVRVSEHHNDYFTRNLVAILVEERLALAVQLGAAMVYGDLSFAG